ncbi:MAG: dehydrogenase, partial [Saprospiraceae bacterium]|nr:dehydrogenase [Saprospiraceae bacterium]
MLSFAKGSSIWSIFFSLLILSCGQQGPSPPKSPEEELATFQLADGLQIELVAAEPLVQDPVFFAFDHLNRLWVAEMSGFNATLDGEGENDPVGRIVVLVDEDGDGQMDARNIFLDSIVLPRSFAFVPGGLLVAERIPLWYVEDLDGDLEADRKTMVDSTYGGRGHVEHSPNGLWWGIDNWIYNAKSTVRYRQKGGVWIKDTTEFRGQWGISHDNYGRLYFNYNWSQLH